MFKITIFGIDSSLLSAVERVGKIVYIDQDRHTFNAIFDGCEIKGKAGRVFIRDPEKYKCLILAKTEFEEINIT